MPANARVVGKVAIKAIPDVTGFNSELRRKLRELRQIEVKVKAVLDKTSLARAEQQIKRLGDTIELNVRLKKLDADAVLVRRQLRERLERYLADTTIRVVVNLDLDNPRAALTQKRINDFIEKNNKRTLDLRVIEPNLTRPNLLMEEFAARWETFNIRPVVNLKEQNLLEQDRRLRDFINDHDDKNITFDLRVDSLWAAARIAYASRPRFVDLILRVDPKSMAKVATVIAALSGGRLIQNIGRDFWEFFRDIDKNLPSFIALTSAIVGVAGAMFGVVSSIVSFGAGLAHILPLLLTLPGLILGTVTAIGVMVVAWSSASEELEALSDNWTELGDIIRDDYWSEAREPIVNLIQGLMPQLRTALGGVSRAMGGFTGALADAFGAELAEGRLESIFSTMEEGFRIMESGAAGFAGAIVNLSQIAGRYFPRLAGWITRNANRFDQWLTDISTDGRLDAWMERGITALYDLYYGLEALGRVFGGLWTAANRAGATGMAGFREQMESWDRLVNDPTSQRQLTDFFEGGRRAAESMGNAVEEIFRGLGEQSHVWEDVFAAAGGVFEDLGAIVGDVLGDADFAQGVRDMFEDFRTGIQELRPAAEPLAELLGIAAGFVGDMAVAFSGPLGTAISTLAPILSDIIQDVTPLMVDLADALNDLLGLPATEQILNDLETAINDLVTAIRVNLPGVQTLLETLLNLTAQVTGGLTGSGDAIGSAAGPWAAFLNFVSGILASIFSVLNSLVLLISAIATTLGAIVMKVWSIIYGVVSSVGAAVMWIGDTIAAFWEALTTWDWAGFAIDMTDINVEYGEIFDGIWEEANQMGEDANRAFVEGWEAFQASGETLIGIDDLFNGNWEALAYLRGLGGGNSVIEGMQEALANGELSVEEAGFLTQLATDLGHQGGEAGSTIAAEYIAALEDALADGHLSLDEITLLTDLAAEMQAAAEPLATGVGEEFVNDVENSFSSSPVPAMGSGGGAGGMPYAYALNITDRINSGLKDGMVGSETLLVPDGQKVSQGLVAGADSGLNEVAASMIRLQVQMIRQWSTSGTMLRVIGTTLPAGLAAGIIQGIPTVLATRQAMAAAATPGSLYGAGYRIGQDLGAGISVGIASTTARIANTAAAAVRAATAAARAAAETASPSKLWRREVGQMLGEGLALGIEDKYGRVAGAANGIIATPDVSFLGEAVAGGRDNVVYVENPWSGDLLLAKQKEVSDGVYADRDRIGGLTASNGWK